jgi:hypothetical protein
MKTTITEMQKRTVECPTCGARRGKPCRSSRQPGPNTFGGGWGGPPDHDRAHAARREAYIAKNAPALDAPKCRACNKTLAQCNEAPECSETNSYEHDIPGYAMRVIVKRGDQFSRAVADLAEGKGPWRAPRMQRNPIGLKFVVHERPAHIIRAFRAPGHPDELTLCGQGGPGGSTELMGYLDHGEFDNAGNPMPVCAACIEALRRFPRAPIPEDSGRYDAQRGEFIRHPHFPG